MSQLATVIQAATHYPHQCCSSHGCNNHASCDSHPRNCTLVHIPNGYKELLLCIKSVMPDKYSVIFASTVVSKGAGSFTVAGCGVS